MKIKTRFAPSPSGDLHLGGARTALYSWLYARHNKGEFILRIEDTDLKRSCKKHVKSIINSMKWLNLNWDQGPFFQTNRYQRYHSIIDTMLKKGTAYKCYCSKEILEKNRFMQLINNQQPHYNRFCRKNNDVNLPNQSYVVRFKNPETGIVKFTDQIRGIIEFKNENLDDLIICRSDGTPTYNFCAVIDDLDMEITHVIRGEDHINNTPKQINILKALNAKIPQYAHVSMIIGENGKKLSKRHETISIMQYRDDGYLPESILNYIVRLGWSHGNQEIFNIDEMVNFFDLKSISKASSILNTKKLIWLNQHYIKKLPLQSIANHLQWHFTKKNINIDNGPNLIEIISLFKNRCKNLKEMMNSCLFFYQEFNNFDDNIHKYISQQSILPLQKIHDKFLTIKEWTLDNIHNIINSTIIELKLNINNVAMPLRIAVTGKCCSPPIDKTIYIIGRNKSIIRIKKIINFIKNSIK